MAIEAEGRAHERREVSDFIAMTPDTDLLAPPSAWLKEGAKDGYIYRSLDSDADNYETISKIISLYIDDPNNIQDLGDILHSGHNADVVRVGKYAIKIFKFDPNASEWERERRSGLCAVRTAVMLELGLARYSNEGIPVATPHLHACYYPEDRDGTPIWIMSYEDGTPDSDVIDADAMHSLQGILNHALQSTGGERLIQTVQFENRAAHWLLQRHQGAVVRLIKLSGCIGSHDSHQKLWQREESLFRI